MSGTAGAASERKRSTASVGKVAGSASRIAPAAPSRSTIPASAPVPSSSSSTIAWKTVALPPSRCAAQTVTAVPCSTSRRAPITPPAAQPASSGRGERLVDGLEHRLGRRQVRARGEHDRQVARRTRRSPSRAVSAASSAPARGSGLVDRPVPMRNAIEDDDTPQPRGPILVACRQRCSPSSARPAWGRPRSPSRWPTRLRAEGEEPVAVSADALQVYRGLEVLTGAATRERAGAARAPADRASWTPTRRSAPASTPAGAPRDRRAAGRRPAPDRRRRHRALPARRARRARPSPAASPGDPRAAPTSSSKSTAPPPCTRELAARAPAAAATVRPDRQPARRPRARAARRRPRSRPPATSCGPSATRHPTLLGRPDDGARARSSGGSTPASTRCSPPAPPRRCAPPTARGASPTVRKALGFRELLDGRRRGDAPQHPPLHAPPADLDAQAARRAPRRRHRPRARTTSPPSCTAP